MDAERGFRKANPLANLISPLEVGAKTWTNGYLLISIQKLIPHALLRRCYSQLFTYLFLSTTCYIQLYKLYWAFRCLVRKVCWQKLDPCCGIQKASHRRVTKVLEVARAAGWTDGGYANGLQKDFPSQEIFAPLTFANVCQHLKMNPVCKMIYNIMMSLHIFATNIASIDQTDKTFTGWKRYGGHLTSESELYIWHVNKMHTCRYSCCFDIFVFSCLFPVHLLAQKFARTCLQVFPWYFLYLHLIDPRSKTFRRWLGSLGMRPE